MKRHMLFGTIALLAGAVVAAEPVPQDDVTSAAKKLGEQTNYSWKTTVEASGGRGGGGRFRRGPTQGKLQKDGYIVSSMKYRAPSASETTT